MIDDIFLQYLLNNPEEISKLNFERISQILKRATEIFDEEDLLIYLNSKNINDIFYIIGDIHGNLQALQKILKIINDTNPNYIIFLGDIVDRGPHQLECLILVLILKILYPKKYFLLRGNHETLEMNKAYGFFYEFINRFEDVSKFNEVARLYRSLPFCIIINNIILCVHGGIPRNINILKELSSLKTKDIISNPNIENDLIELMWNDPKKNVKNFRPSFRGPGVFDFGEYAFNEFLEKNSLKYIIRAHECFPEGYRWFFKKRLSSIFSAPNYRGGFYGNPGSYAVVRGEEIIPKIFD